MFENFNQDLSVQIDDLVSNLPGGVTLQSKSKKSLILLINSVLYNLSAVDGDFVIIRDYDDMNMGQYTPEQTIEILQWYLDNPEYDSDTSSKYSNSRVSSNIINDIIDFIRPSDPMMSNEYRYYCWGDDEAYYNNKLTDKDYLDCIEVTVFKEDSNTAKKFGWDFIQKNKEEILSLCRKELESLK